MSLGRYAFAKFVVTTGWNNLSDKGNITVWESTERDGRHDFLERFNLDRITFFSLVGRLCNRPAASFEEAKRLLTSD